MFNSPRPILLALLSLALLFALARAIQTPEVEIGNAGAYDGTVKITRDASGRMLLSDIDVPTPVTLNDLRYAGRDHGLLLGLLDDDHPQYLNAARHDLLSRHALGTVVPHDTLANLAGNALAGLAGKDLLYYDGAAALWKNGSFSALGLEPALAPGAATHYLRGDKTWQPLAQAAVAGLTAVDSPSFTALKPGNLQLAGNTLSSTNANGPIVLAPSGTGKVGIGIAAPTKLMEICQPAALNGLALVLSTSNGYGATGGGTGIEFRDNAIHTGHLECLWDGTYTNLYFGGLVSPSVGNATTQQMILMGNGNLNLLTGGLQTNGTTRIDAGGNAAFAQTNSGNMQLAGNTLSSTNAGGDINLTPNGTGRVNVSGDLAAGSGGGKLTLNGQRFMNELNLLNNPDFTIWQRNTSQLCAAGGNADGTLTYPVPGTLTLGADRWQVSRSRTDMSSTISRATPPAPLATALYCLKNELAAGTACNQYIHQTLPRELTAGLRGKWVTFAVSHFMAGTSGGTVGIYKLVGGAPTALATYPFASTAGAWERVAVAAQVPADAEVLLVSVMSNLAAGGPTVAYVANAVLVEGKYVNTTEKVSDLSLSSVPPLPRPPAEDLAASQRYYEKGSLGFSAYSPDAALNAYSTAVRFNTAKAASPTLVLANLSSAPLSNPTVSITAQPAYSAGAAWPQGFQATFGGSTGGSALFTVTADWTATCPEPI